MFDTAEQKRSQGNRGKIPLTHELKERPVAANERVRFGDFAADTIIVFNHKSAWLSLADRKSRFLLCAKLSSVGSVEVEKAMTELLGGQPLLAAENFNFISKYTVYCVNIFHYKQWLILNRCTSFDNSRLQRKVTKRKELKISPKFLSCAVAKPACSLAWRRRSSVTAVTTFDFVLLVSTSPRFPHSVNVDSGLVCK